MQPTDEIRQLLVEIRDIQREHFAAYTRVTNQSLELQQQAVKRQEQIGRLYQSVVAVGTILVVCLLALLVFVMGRLRWL
jgi:CHASE3 domain sensor protein